MNGISSASPKLLFPVSALHLFFMLDVLNTGRSQLLDGSSVVRLGLLVVARSVAKKDLACVDGICPTISSVRAEDSLSSTTAEQALLGCASSVLVQECQLVMWLTDSGNLRNSKHAGQ